jgi:hypothetical protein
MAGIIRENRCVCCGKNLPRQLFYSPALLPTNFEKNDSSGSQACRRLLEQYANQI